MLICSMRQHTSAYVSIRQRRRSFRWYSDTSMLICSMRQHTSAYISIRQHTSASEELSLARRHKHVDLQSSVHVIADLRAYETHELEEDVGDLERSILLLLLFLKQVALDAVLNSAHENNHHRETSGESGAANGSKM